MARQYAYCGSVGCEYYEEQIPLRFLKGSRQCDGCDGDLIIVGTSDGLYQYDLERYPTPLAISLKRLHESKGTEERSRSLTEAITQLGKYLALIGASDYLRSDQQSPSLTSLLSRDLARPQVSTWFRLIDQHIRIEDNHHFIPELNEFWLTVTSKSDPSILIVPYVHLGREGDSTSTDEKLTPIEYLLNYRNNWAHRTGLNPAQLTGYTREAEGVLAKLLDRLSWLWEYTVIARFEQARVTHTSILRGPNIDLQVHTGSEVDIVLQKPDETSELTLLPFYVAFSTEDEQSQEQQTSDRSSTSISAQNDLNVLEEVQRKHLVYSSTLTGKVSRVGHYHSTWENLLNRKVNSLFTLLEAVDLSWGELHERSKNDLERGLTSVGLGNSLSLYCERILPESQLEKWTKTKERFCLFIGQGGLGKSSTLAYLAQKWSDQGDLVLWISVMVEETFSIADMIHQRLGLSENVSLDLVESILLERDSQLILIMDGLNESKDREQVLNEICTELDRSSQIKILLSTRALPQHHGLIERRNKIYKPQVDSFVDVPREDQVIPFIKMNRLNHSEREAMWAKYSAAPKRKIFGHQIGFRPQFELFDLRLNHSHLPERLQSPLQLSMFLKVFHGQQLPKKLTIEDLNERYVRYIGKWPEAAALLSWLADQMWLKKTRLLSTETLYTLFEESGRTAEYLSSEGPIAQLIDIGVISFSRREQDAFVAPRIDGIFEYLIAKSLIKSNEGQVLSALSIPLKSHPFGEGVYTALIKALASPHHHSEPNINRFRKILSTPHQDDWPAKVIGEAIADYVGEVKSQSAREALLHLCSSVCPDDYAIFMSCSEELRDFGEKELEIAVSLMTSLKNLSKDISFDNEQQYCICDELAFLFGYSGDWLQCNQNALECVTLAEKIVGHKDQDSMLARALNHLAQSSYHLGDTDTGLAACKRARDVYSTSDTVFTVQPFYTYQTELMLARQKRDLEYALKVSDDLLRYADDPLDYGTALSDKGLIFLELAQFENAMALFQDSYQIISTEVGPEALGPVRLNIALCHSMMGQLEESYKAFLSLYEECNNVDYFGDDMNVGVRLCFGEFLKINNLDGYHQLLNEALEITRDQGGELEILTITYYLLHLQHEMEDTVIDQLFNRTKELNCPNQLMFPLSKIKAFQLLHEGDFETCIQVIEDTFEKAGVSAESLYEHTEHAQQERWTSLVLGAENCLPLNFCWVMARSSKEGLTNELKLRFEECLRSPKVEAMPAYHCYMRNEFAQKLLLNQEVELARYHAQRSLQETLRYDPDLITIDYLIALEILLKANIDLNRSEDLEELWSAYMSRCTELETDIVSEIEEIYLGYIRDR